MKIMQQKANKRILSKAGFEAFVTNSSDYKCEERRKVNFYRLIHYPLAIRPHTLQSLLKTDNSRICCFLRTIKAAGGVRTYFKVSGNSL